ncbi:hypothetical protein AB0C77_30800 [Streptomyces sp. NPDC048629]|uniref:RapZ C-terminal domain-containing protein n=1 Tax=Streptomyces sp. NPDC048629 TaxID=3154824 RepID=UPI00343E06C4
MTGLDAFARDYVLQTHGVRPLIDRTSRLALMLLAPENMARWSGAQLRRVDIHVAGHHGQHRCVAIAEEIAAGPRAAGTGCEVEPRHIGKPQS